MLEQIGVLLALLGHLSVIEYTDHKFNGLANICLTFIVWVLYAVILVSASALFSHYVAQQAIGSGIPEMKTYAFLKSPRPIFPIEESSISRCDIKLIMIRCSFA